MDNQVSLEDWYERKLTKLNTFVKLWKIRNTIHPKQFPMNLPLGEWDEQYTTYWDLNDD